MSLGTQASEPTPALIASVHAGRDWTSPAGRLRSRLGPYSSNGTGVQLEQVDRVLAKPLAEKRMPIG
jgi:hypothetical protein